MKPKKHKKVNNAKDGVQNDSRAVSADNNGGKQAATLPKQAETSETDICFVWAKLRLVCRHCCQR